MKKLLFALLAGLLVFGLQAHAAVGFDRPTKIVKICRYVVTTAANASADAILTQADGTAYCDISNLVVDRVVLEDNITALTGTNVIFKVVTTSDPSNSGATTDPALDGSDGATDLVSATISAVGRHSKGTSMNPVGASGVTENLGTKIGVWADVSSLTVLDGFVYLVIFGK